MATLQVLVDGCRFAYDHTVRPVRTFVYDHLVDHVQGHAGEVEGDTSPSLGATRVGRASSSSSSSSSMPGPISFITSPYCIILLCLSILLNRIHHLVPPRRPMLLQNPDGSSAGLSIRQRSALRLPSLALLLRAATLLAVILLETQLDHRAVSATIWGRSWIRAITTSTRWAGKSELRQFLVDPETLSVLATSGRRISSNINPHYVLLEVFFAVAFSTVTESFVRALADELGSQASFNLLSFTFLLHINSSTAYRSAPGGETTWSPPTNLYIHLLLTLLELFALHASFIVTPPLKPLRLAISGVFSCIGQAIFSVSLYKAILVDEFEANASFVSDEYDADSLAGMFWFSLFPEVAFETLAIMAIVLRGSTCLLRGDDMSLEAVFGNRAHWPKWSDDWGVAMIKYATSCLESSSLAGLANEVSPIRILAPAPLALLSLRLPPETIAPTDDYVRLARGAHDSGHVQYRSSETSRRPKAGRGFNHEIRSIQVARREGEEVGGIGGGEQRRKAWWKLVGLVWRMSFYLVWKALTFVAKGVWAVGDFFGLVKEEDKEAEAMGRWVARGTGEEIEDAEDGDFVLSNSEEGGSSSEDEAEVEEDGDDEVAIASVTSDEDDSDDAATLLQELVGAPSRRERQRKRSSVASTRYSTSRAFSPELLSTSEDLSLAPIILAHHLAPAGGSPLTRRRYASLATSSSAPSRAFSSALDERRLEVAQQARQRGLPEGWEVERRKEIDEGRQRFCVVCTVEERSIICWPCRCLTICEECRGSLSERTPANQHLCPTCRTKVEGFSRIYIP